jgi:hypothetical protein
MIRSRIGRARHPRTRGQALVEFALAIPVFLVLLMGIIDLGRGIYMYNGVSQAAREIARVTSVHPGSPLGDSTETAEVIATQQGLIPGFEDPPEFDCVDIDGSTISTPCVPGMQVRVKVIAEFTPITPLLGLSGTWDLQSTSSVSIQ